MNSSLKTKIYWLFFIITLAACSTKQATQNVQMAGNRKMGVILQNFPSDDSSSRTYYENLLVQSIQDTYHSHVEILSIQNTSLIEAPENLFQVANAEIDDLFIFDIKFPSNDLLPPTKPEDQVSEKQLSAQFPSQSVEISARVLNGANLRTVTLLKANLPWGFKDEFERMFKSEVKKVAMNSFANPNIYPPSDPLHFANLLFVYSEGLEKQSLESLNCANAKSILGFYDMAYRLYEKGKDKTSQETVSSQEKIHELNLRLEQSKRKSDILKKCEEDTLKSFEMIVDYGSIDPSYQVHIQKAFETIKLEALLRKYTNKPVHLNFSLSPEGDISLRTVLRYDPQRYIQWTKDRVPATAANYHLVSLDPYHALMQTLVLLKYFIPAEAPQPLKTSFLKMRSDLTLDTLLNGQMSFQIAGTYNAEDKRVLLAYPKSLFLVAPGFESKTIFTRSDEIFQEKGWLAFGSCKTIDGTLTEDGLVLRFLGLNCKI